MNLTLTLIGAGEHTSLEAHTTDSYLRFRAADGAEFDVECTGEQLSTLLEFAAVHRAGDSTVVSTTAAQVDEDTDASDVIQLRDVRSPSPFASPDDDL